MRLTIKQGQHVLLCGMTGSGKTTLAKRILSSRRNVIVVDTKHELRWPGFKITSSVPIATTETHSIFRPSGINPILEVDKLLKRVYQMGGWDICIDEIYSLGRGSVTSYPQSYIMLLTRGRSRHITVWTGTQRPRFLPLFAVSESQHIFLFEVGSTDDRKHVAKLAGVEGLETLVTGHEFLYYNRPQRRIVKSILERGDL